MRVKDIRAEHIIIISHVFVCNVICLRVTRALPRIAGAKVVRNFGVSLPGNEYNVIIIFIHVQCIQSPNCLDE